jgi:integrase
LTEPTLYLAAAMTRLRQGGLLGLRWRDVEPRHPQETSRPAYARSEFGDPKSEGSGRSVPLATRVVEALSELRDRSAYSDDGELAFCHPESGRPLNQPSDAEADTVDAAFG